MDSYQAIYDAVRSRLSNGDVGAAIASAVHVDASFAIAILQEQFMCSAMEMQRPSVLLKPRLSRDGNQWCVLYGDDLMEGIAGFGETPDQAARAFDLAWNTEKITIPLVDARKQREDV